MLKSIKVSCLNPPHHKEIRTKQLFWTKLARFSWLFAAPHVKSPLLLLLHLSCSRTMGKLFVLLKPKFSLVILSQKYSISFNTCKSLLFMVHSHQIRNWGMELFLSWYANLSLRCRFGWIYHLPFHVRYVYSCCILFMSL